MIILLFLGCPTNPNPGAAQWTCTAEVVGIHTVRNCTHVNGTRCVFNGEGVDCDFKEKE